MVSENDYNGRRWARERRVLAKEGVEIPEEETSDLKCDSLVSSSGISSHPRSRPEGPAPPATLVIIR